MPIPGPVTSKEVASIAIAVTCTFLVLGLIVVRRFFYFFADSGLELAKLDSKIRALNHEVLETLAGATDENGRAADNLLRAVRILTQNLDMVQRTKDEVEKHLAAAEESSRRSSLLINGTSPDEAEQMPWQSPGRVHFHTDT